MILSINSKQDLSKELVLKTVWDNIDKSKQMEVEERNMILDFYDGQQDKPEYLKRYGFQEKDALPLQTINIFKKVIDKISLVYKNQPDRYFEDSKESEYSEWITSSTANQKFVLWQKEAERKKNALGMVLKRPVYLKDKGWRFFVDTQWEGHFALGDPFTPIAYSIPIGHDTTTKNMGGNEDEDWLMFWSDTFYFWYQKDSEKVFYDPAFPTGEHKLGLIPIVESRTNFPTEDYWVTGATDLMLSNQNINIALNNLNYAIHYQAFDQPWAEGIDSEEAKKIQTGPDTLPVLPEGASLNLLGYSPKITEMVEAIKFHFEAISRTYNVNIDWSMSGTPASGFSLLVKNIDALEAREDDVEIAEMEEQQLREIIQRQQEVYNIPKEPRFPAGKKLIVDFHEIDFPTNQAEETQRHEFEYKWNIKTPIDTIQSDQGLTQEEAEKRYFENKKLNESLTPAQQQFRDTLEGLNEPEPTGEPAENGEE